jgi:hypothetical protein
LDDHQLQKGFPSAVPARFIAMGELTVFLVSEEDLKAIERGSPGTTMANIANTLLSVAAGLLGSLLLSGPPQSVFRFCVFTILISLSSLGGVVLLILSRCFKSDRSDTIAEIRARKNAPKGKAIQAPPVVADTTEGEDAN